MTPSRKPAVLFVSPEAAPLAKVGGLADVVGSLPKALRELGCDARLILPCYGSLDLKAIDAKRLGAYPVPFGDRIHQVTMFKARLPGSATPLYLLQEPNWLSSGEIYQAPIHTDHRRFLVKRSLFFCLAVWRGLPHLGWRPDLFHLHDWMTAPLTILAEHLTTSQAGIKPIPTLLTIHNLDHQEHASDADLQRAGLHPEQMRVTKTNAKENRYTNLLGEGIIRANGVNTVSPRYAKEIRLVAFGHGLEKVIKLRKNGVSGILNGIDTTVFNPQTDRALAARYDVYHLNKKLFNKKGLQRRLGLPVDENVLLCGVVSRLAPQKGIQLLLEAIPQLASRQSQFVILGQGQPEIVASLNKAARQHPARVAFVKKFDAQLAQLIYAGSDVFLMPSAFEPCGLGQMIAMRYGTLPIVRDTGGLHDTVRDYRKPKGQGFVFKQFSAAALLKSLLDAQKVFANKKRWQQLQRQVMQEDFSWEKSAKKYIQLYNKILQLHK